MSIPLKALSSELQSNHQSRTVGQTLPGFLNNSIQSAYKLPALELQKSNKTIVVKIVKIIGNTVLSKSELKPIIGKVIGNQILPAQIEQVRHLISLLYFKKGYINSGVLIQQNSNSNGVLTYIAVEGGITEYKFNGINAPQQKILKEQLVSQISNPLNINMLQETLNKLSHSSKFKLMNSRLHAGEKLGSATLEIDVIQIRKYRGLFGIDNYRSPAVGAERAFVGFSKTALLASSDTIAIQAGITRGINDYSVNYDLPIRQLKGKTSFYYIKNDSQFIEDELASLNLENNASVYGFKISSQQYSLFNQNKNETLELSVEHLKNRNNLIGRDTIWAMELGHQLNIDAFTFNHKFKSNLRLGQLESLYIGSTSRTETFQKLKLSTRSSKKTVGGQILEVKSRTQITQNLLIGLERMGMGGYYSVRGYRESTLSKDNGIIINLNYFIKSKLKNLYWIGFADTAVGWNVESNTEKQSLASMGIGLSWQYMKKIYIDGILGIPLTNKTESEEKNLQDYGIHFGLNYQL